MAGVDPQQPHRPLAWGGVPGQWQTVPRAELVAFVAAVYNGLRFSQATPGSPKTFAIWSDCEYVVRKAKRIQQGRCMIHRMTRMTPNHDLWQMVVDMLPAESICQLNLFRSHQEYQDAGSMASMGMFCK